MDISKCNIYFGNYQIKTGYFGNNKFYEKKKNNELKILKMGSTIINNIYIAPVTTILTDTINLLKMEG